MSTNMVNTGFLDGLRSIFNTVSTVDISAGACRDSKDVYTMMVDATLTANIAASGVNGLDTGSEAADTLYAKHVIGDSTGVNMPASLLSISATAPTLPSGYDVFRRVSWIFNDSSSDFINFIQVWNGRTRRYSFDLNHSVSRVLTDGSATSWTDINLATFVPLTSNNVILFVAFQTSAGGATGDEVKFRSNGFSASAANSAWHVRIGIVSDEKNQTHIEIPCPGQIIEYKVDNALNSVHVSVIGFDDEI